MSIPRSLCNDLNRLATVNVITFLVNKSMGNPQNFTSWKDGLLRDIGILMVYHQVLARFIPNSQARPLVEDLAKTSILMLVPTINNPNWKQVFGTLSLVVLYHKVIRKHLISYLKANNIGFNEGIEDMIETMVLLSISKENGMLELLSQLCALGIYHATLKHN